MHEKQLLASSIVFVFLLSTMVFALGVTSPVPKDMQLLRGESALFEFQIQAVTSTDNLVCTYSMTDPEPLTIDFDFDSVTVTAGSVKKVYGTVYVPEDAPFDSYTSELVVSCGAETETGAGSQVKTTITGGTLSLDVVQYREAEKREAEIPGIPMSELIILIILLIILIGAYYLYKQKYTKKSRKRKR